MKIVTPFSALLSVYRLRKPGSARTLDSMRLALCSILASDKMQRLGQMFPQPASGDVEVSGPTIHSNIPYVSRLRLEGRDRRVDAGDIEPFRGEIRIYLAWYRPRHQRFDKTKALIIRDVTISTPQVISGLRQHGRELRATKHRPWRGHILQAGMQEAEAPRVDFVFEQLGKQIPVPIAFWSNQHPWDRALRRMSRLLSQRSFLPDRAVQYEVVRCIGHLSVSFSLGGEAKVEYGVKDDTFLQAAPVSRVIYPTDRPQDALLG